MWLLLFSIFLYSLTDYNMLMMKYGKYIYAQTNDLNYNGCILYFVRYFSVLETDVSERAVKMSGSKQPIIIAATLSHQFSAACHLQILVK